MTNIKEKIKQDDVQLHINKAFKFIDAHLPVYYVSKVLEKLPKDTSITSGIIRNVRNKTNPNLQNRIDIINLLVEVAKDNLNEKKKLSKIT